MYRIYDIIHLPDGYMYAVDKEGEILYDEWCFEYHENYDNPEYNHQKYVLPNGVDAYWLRPLNMDYLKEKPKEFRFWRKMDGSCWKVVATNNPSLNLPLLPEVKENIYEIALEQFPENWQVIQGESCNQDIDINEQLRNGFCVGYKAASAKQYTEEDLRKAIELAREQYWETGGGGLVKQGSWEFKLQYKQDIDEMIKSLKPKPIKVEVEMIEDLDPSNHGFKDITLEQYPKTINNIIQVKHWIYE